MKNIIDFDADSNTLGYKQNKIYDDNIIIDSMMNNKQDINTYNNADVKENTKYNVFNQQKDTRTNIINNEKIESNNNLDDFEINYNSKKDSVVENTEELDKKDVIVDKKEDIDTLGEKIKGIASSINLSLSALPETIKKKRESKNRIKKNQIFSTSFNKKGKRK